MTKNALRLSLAALIIFAVLLTIKIRPSHADAGPLRRAKLLALVSGEVLDTTIVAEIRHRALAFSPDNTYLALLKEAGAPSNVLDAVRKAKTSSIEGPTTPQDSLFLQHLAKAGSLAKAGKNDEAAAEVAAAISKTSDSAKLDAGFVMAHILINQERVDEAGNVLSEIAAKDPAYPAVEMRLSYIAWKLNDTDECLRHARAAIAANPDDAVAHRNAGTALMTLHKFDAAKLEYEQSIRANPGFAPAYEDLGALLEDFEDWDAAITQLKKALVLKPDDANAHYNLGVAYGNKHDDQAAIREYREAKRLDPQRIDVRQNLATNLEDHDPTAALSEFQELAAIAPNFALCRIGMAGTYVRLNDLENAKKQYEVAASLDPSSADPYLGLAFIDETQKNYDAALQNYRRAQEVDPTSAAGFSGAGRMLFEKGEYRAAAAELERAEKINPADWNLYNLRGHQLAAAGDLKAAMAEFHQSLALAPKEVWPRLGLAEALEKSGDWISALEEYRRAAADEPPPVLHTAQMLYESQKKYDQAQQRFKDHLAALHASGKSAEAGTLEATWKAKLSVGDLDEKFHAAIQASVKAGSENRLDDAETSSKEAVIIAEKIQPMDGRLPEALNQLGALYAKRAEYAKASEVLHRQLALTQQLFGSDSSKNTQPLLTLCVVALAQKNFQEAEKYVLQAISLNERAFGENSVAVGSCLRQLSAVYFKENEFAKAEPVMQRSIHIYEMQNDDLQVSLSVNILCQIYDTSGQFEKSQSCHARMVSWLEKRFGVDSVYLVQDLSAQAKALRQLGRTEEAVKLEQRAKALQSAAPSQAAVQPQN